MDRPGAGRACAGPLCSGSGAVRLGDGEVAEAALGHVERPRGHAPATGAHRTGDELSALVSRFIDLDSVDGICLASTVPALIREYEVFSGRRAKALLLVVGQGIRTVIEGSTTIPARSARMSSPTLWPHGRGTAPCTIRAELGADACAIATGGLAELISPHDSSIERVYPF